jgi:ribose/xylose/arabinose/galactoside ABC-type transport system permease subunit
MMDKAPTKTAPAQTRFRNLDAMGFLSRYGTLVALVLLIGFNLAHTPNFATMQTLNINLTQVATIVIVAVGMTLVIATGGIDLSVGSLMAIAGALAPLIFTGRLASLGGIYVAVAVAIIAAILLTGILGALNGYLVARFRIQPIVATLVLFIAGRGIAQVMTNGNLQTFRVPEFAWIGLGRPLGIPAQVIIMAVLVAIAAWALRKTVFGRHVLAVGGNETAALLAGLPVARVKLLVYTISGMCAGLAGLVVIGINSSSDANLVGLGMELDAIAAVAVGGTLMSGGKATVVGTLLGALTIQLVRYTLLSNGVPDAAALVVKAGIIAVAVWLQRQHRSA